MRTEQTGWHGVNRANRMSSAEFEGESGLEFRVRGSSANAR